ncbi:uncharacterized protein LOC122540438 isoform X5 [Chiloscyllium plagiosum]|uniref:uncharacterized protein LOC122540438 isoform X5 n=1 Tax=Chiloscyllium plagiosum TaxID=36176 RepID=UPI001CB7BB9C|nr:uncharacterized protein LOC122540438 isoform X5 [Chiloscyllium plagiosum]
MLHYCIAHLAYHFSRQLPKRSRAKFEILVIMLVTIILFPQIFVLLRPKSSRYCGQPLLINLTSFIIFTFIMTGKHNSRAVLPELIAVCTECACNSFHRFLDSVLAS